MSDLELAQQAPVDQLRQAIARLDAERDQLAEAGNLDTLAVGLAQLRLLAKDLRTLTEAVEADVANMMPAKTHEIDGFGVLEVRTSTTRNQWQWESLWPALVRLTLDPEGTGELPELPTVVASMTSLVEQVIGLTGSKGPRLTQLRALGFDPDEWSSIGRTKQSVQIHGGEA